MTNEFCIPAKPQDLINEDVELPFKIRRLHNFEDAAPAEIEEYAEGNTYFFSVLAIIYRRSLCRHEALC